jgi:hypothetical protein
VLGLGAIRGSGGPDATDPQEVQLIGAAFIAIGLAHCGGVWVVRKTPTCQARPPDPGTDLNPLKRRGVTDGAVLAIAGALCLIFGVIALVYSLSLDSAARDFKSAAPCQPGIQNTDCYEQRAIGITGVGTGRWGEVNTVDFLDNGKPHESSLGPGGQDKSVLRSGASGIATLWHGRYTNLDVAGIDFLTKENPVGQEGLWTLFAFIGIGFALIIWAASLAWYVMNRRGLKPPPTDPSSLALPPGPTADLIP